LLVVGLGICKPQVVAQAVLKSSVRCVIQAAAAGLNHAFVRLRSPAIKCSKLVLPAPLLPISATRSPWRTFRSIGPN
jgi:hypothetical protein